MPGKTSCLSWLKKLAKKQRENSPSLSREKEPRELGKIRGSYLFFEHSHQKNSTAFSPLSCTSLTGTVFMSGHKADYRGHGIIQSPQDNLKSWMEGGLLAWLSMTIDNRTIGMYYYSNGNFTQKLDQCISLLPCPAAFQKAPLKLQSTFTDFELHCNLPTSSEKYLVSWGNIFFRVFPLKDWDNSCAPASSDALSVNVSTVNCDCDMEAATVVIKP